MYRNQAIKRINSISSVIFLKKLELLLKMDELEKRIERFFIKNTPKNVAEIFKHRPRAEGYARLAKDLGYKLDHTYRTAVLKRSDQESIGVLFNLQTPINNNLLPAPLYIDLAQEDQVKDFAHLCSTLRSEYRNLTPTQSSEEKPQTQSRFRYPRTLTGIAAGLIFDVPFYNFLIHQSKSLFFLVVPLLLTVGLGYASDRLNLKDHSTSSNTSSNYNQRYYLHLSTEFEQKYGSKVFSGYEALRRALTVKA